MDLFRHRRQAALVLAGLALLCLSAPASAQPKTSESKVKITGAASKPDADGKQLVTLTLTIEKGWHLYANPVGNQDFADAQTSVAIKASQPLKEVKIDYPAGKVEKDKTLGNFNVYEGTVVIKGHLRRTAGDNSPLEVSVKLQACSDKNCLLPGTAKLTVK